MSARLDWIALDTETTGLLLPSIAPLEKQPKIIELAIIKLSFGGDEIVVGQDGAEVPRVTEKSWLINPGEPLSADIVRITGLKDDDLKGQPRFAEIAEEVTEHFIGVTGMIAHNLSFDLGMLVNELKRLGKETAFPYPPKQLCTVIHYSQTLFGRRAKLTEVYQRVLGRPLPQKHRALDDTRALVELVIQDKLCGN